MWQWVVRSYSPEPPKRVLVLMWGVDWVEDSGHMLETDRGVHSTSWEANWRFRAHVGGRLDDRFMLDRVLIGVRVHVGEHTG